MSRAVPIRRPVVAVLAACIVAGAPGSDARAAKSPSSTGACGAPGATEIFDIQGAGASSPLEGRKVSLEAVVTGDFQDGRGEHGDLDGFYVQAREGDGDPRTSDGVFVFDRPGPKVDVRAGDLVRVSGKVTEFFGETHVSASSVVVCGRGSRIEPVTVRLPAKASRKNADGALIADLERFEGMLVRIESPLTVTDLGFLDRFGEILLASGGRLYQHTNLARPSKSANARHLGDVARRSLRLDDGAKTQNPRRIRYPAPGLASDNTVRLGDTVAGLTGNVRFSRGAGKAGDEDYRLMPIEEPAFTRRNKRPGPPRVGGRLRVASFNVLNFFNDLGDRSGRCFPSFTREDCRGASNRKEFERQRARLARSLATIGADVYGLIELENDYPDAKKSSIATLVGDLNRAGVERCPGGYRYVDPGRRVGDDVIAVGLVYCTGTVELAPGTSPAVLDDAGLRKLRLARGGPVFNGDATNRSPLAATFVERESGEALTVVVSHFKSKGPSSLGDRACAGRAASNPNCDQGDGQGFWNARRSRGARATVAWLDTDPTGSGDPDRLVLGDLNAYLREDPLREFTGKNAYVNLVDTLGGGGKAYSFVFRGQSGALDHALASRSLECQVRGFAEWHGNTDEADALDYNLDFRRDPRLFDPRSPYRSSDHDPLVIGLDLGQKAKGCG